MKLGELIPELPVTQEPTKKERKKAKKQAKKERWERYGQLKASAAHEIAHRRAQELAGRYYSECSCGLFHMLPLSGEHQAVGSIIPVAEYDLKNWQTPVPCREETVMRTASHMRKQLITQRNAFHVAVSIK